MCPKNETKVSLHEEFIAAAAEADKEVNQRAMSKLSDTDKKLSRIASDLLVLERDLTLPGSNTSHDGRVERLLSAISRESI